MDGQSEDSGAEIVPLLLNATTYSLLRDQVSTDSDESVTKYTISLISGFGSF